MKTLLTVTFFLIGILALLMALHHTGDVIRVQQAKLAKDSLIQHTQAEEIRDLSWYKIQWCDFTDCENPDNKGFVYIKHLNIDSIGTLNQY